jgi:hypothetical protein
LGACLPSKLCTNVNKMGMSFMWARLENRSLKNNIKLVIIAVMNAKSSKEMMKKN